MVGKMWLVTEIDPSFNNFGLKTLQSTIKIVYEGFFDIYLNYIQKVGLFLSSKQTSCSRLFFIII